MKDHDYAVNLCNLRVNEKVDYTQSSMYTQLEISASFQSSVQKSLNLLTTSRVDGLVYIGVHPRDVGNILPHTDIPVIYTYSYTKENDYCVNYDDYQGAQLVVEFLLNMGHKRIGLICGSIDSVFRSQTAHGLPKCTYGTRPSLLSGIYTLRKLAL